jgi:hypothetical protein
MLGFGIFENLKNLHSWQSDFETDGAKFLIFGAHFIPHCAGQMSALMATDCFYYRFILIFLLPRRQSVS